MRTQLNSTQSALLSYAIPAHKQHLLTHDFVLLDIENAEEFRTKLLAGYKIAEFIESQGRVN